MPDYIKINSKNYHKNNKNMCSKWRFQSYEHNTLGDEIKAYIPNTCALSLKCRNSEYKFNKHILEQQNLYAMMRLHPERFPIISSVHNIGLTPIQQRAYSNIYYKRLGTSQAMPVNDNWGGFALTGSDVPYTN